MSDNKNSGNRGQNPQKGHSNSNDNLDSSRGGQREKDLNTNNRSSSQDDLSSDSSSRSSDQSGNSGRSDRSRNR